MEGMTIADGVAAGIVLISAILAYTRGFVREITAILGWIGAAVAAFYFAPQAKPLMLEIPYLRDLIDTSCQLQILSAFAAVFVVALVILSIFTPLFAAAVQDSAIGPLDRGAGFLFGAARGVLLIVVALVVYQLVGLSVVEIDESRTITVLADARDQLHEQIPTEMPAWIETRYNQLLGADCAPGTAATPETAPTPTPTPDATPAPTPEPEAAPQIPNEGNETDQAPAQ
ncbi:MAG: CvpA family protein [Pseudomonadota bacterium]